jgi:hypothetical protein
MKLRSHHSNTVSLLTIIARAAGPFKNIPILPILLDEQLKLFTFLFRPKRFLKMRELSGMVIDKLNLETVYHRFGGLEFRYEGEEIAHLHGNGLLDILFPKKLSAFLIEKGITSMHHIYPASGWTSFLIKGNTNIESCFELIRYKLLLQKGELKVNVIIEKFQYEPYEK